MSDFAKKLKEEPLYLTKVIVYNNPVAVMNNMIATGITATPIDDVEKITELLFDSFESLSDGDIYNILSVDFNDHADNDTVNLYPVLVERQNDMHANGFSVQLNWGDLYESTIMQAKSAYEDFTENTRPEKKPDNKDKSPKKECGCKSAKKHDDKVIIMNCLFLVLIVLGVFFLVKYW